MDPMKRVAAGAVKKNLGPDPSMGRKVELLRKLVAMRKDGPMATTNPPKRGVRVNRGLRIPGRGGGSLPAMPGREMRGKPTRLPRYDRMRGM
jgi:hypothetical protein